MPERPILFSGPMVHAILDGRKTQTRRAVKDANLVASLDCPQIDPRDLYEYCPYGQPGDRLWVRETWQDYCPLWAGAWCGHGTQEGIRRDHIVVYKADDPSLHLIHDTPEMAAEHGRDFVADPIGPPLSWRNAMFMPRRASRITLEITDVRAQRVQEISEEDAKAEGCIESPFTEQDNAELQISDERPDIKALGRVFAGGTFTAKLDFMRLWDSINGKTYPWSANPWVWAITFRVSIPTPPAENRGGAA